jgi:hypothetical protein
MQEADDAEAAGPLDERRELHRLVEHPASRDRHNGCEDDYRVGALLNRLYRSAVTFPRRVTSEYHTYQDACRHERPHERQVPLQPAAEPAAEAEKGGGLEEARLRDLLPEARKRREDLEPAGDQDAEQDRVEPVRGADNPRMRVRGQRPACHG